MAKQQKKKNPYVNKNFILQKLDFRWPALIAVFAFALYANTIRHEYVMDDWGAITGNQFVQKGIAGIPDLLKVDFWYFTNVPLGYYRPLPPITFAIEHEFLGVRPHASHFINVLLFSLTGFLLCLLLMELFSDYNKAFPFLISMLFIAHPIHTEVLANLKSRDEVISFLGLITMLFIMVRYHDSRKKIFLIISLIAFYCALLSKETAMTGIILLPVTLYFFRQTSIPEAIKKTIPFVIAVGVFYFQKYAMLGSLSAKVPVDIINYPYVKSTMGSSMVIFAYCLKLLFLPHPLIFNYSYNQIPAGTASNPVAWIGFLLFGILIFYTIREFFKKSTLGYALTIFMITLLPALAFVIARGGIMAERFIYAPSLGFCIAVVYLLNKGFKADLKNREVKLLSLLKKNNTGPVVIIAIAFAAFSFKTVDRNKAWHDNFTISHADVVYSENNSQCNFVYGSDLIYKAEAEKDSSKKIQYMYEGISHLKRSVEIAPRYGAAWCNLARAYHVIKYIPDSAIYFYRKSNDAYTNGFYISYNNLGMIYQSMGRNELASYYYNRAIESNPTFPDAQRNSAELKKATGLDVHVYPGGEKEFP